MQFIAAADQITTQLLPESIDALDATTKQKEELSTSVHDCNCHNPRNKYRVYQAFRNKYRDKYRLYHLNKMNGSKE